MIKDNIKRLLYYCGYYKIHAMRKKPPEHRLLIALYHDLVSDNPKDRGPFSEGKPTQSQFHAHMIALGSRFRILSIEDAIAEIKAKGQLDHPTACITFDDGCRAVYDLAFPVLKKLNASATVYLPTEWINRNMTPWWILLKNIFLRWEPHRIPLETALKRIGFEASFNQAITAHNDKLRHALASKLENRLRPKPSDEIELEIEKIKTALDIDLDGNLQGNDPMTWDQIREMSAAGSRFGAHTRTHINLKYADKKTAEKEIIESKKEIEERLSVDVCGFAYPYGLDLDVYAKLVETLEKNGFDYACTAAYGNNSPGDNLFLLRRISLPQTSSPALLGRSLILDYY